MDSKLQDLPLDIVEYIIDKTPMTLWKKIIFGKAVYKPVPVSAIINVDLAKAAVNHGLPKDSRVTAIIASNGDLDVLKCLIEEGCEVNYSVLDSARKHPDVWAWLNAKFPHCGLFGNILKVAPTTVDPFAPRTRM
jgi:hypothetical protein